MNLSNDESSFQPFKIANEYKISNINFNKSHDQRGTLGSSGKLSNSFNDNNFLMNTGRSNGNGNKYPGASLRGSMLGLTEIMEGSPMRMKGANYFNHILANKSPKIIDLDGIKYSTGLVTQRSSYFRMNRDSRGGGAVANRKKYI